MSRFKPFSFTSAYDYTCDYIMTAYLTHNNSNSKYRSNSFIGGGFFI